MILTAGVAPVEAAPVDQCTTTTGVVVAVDFGHWGGSIQRGCDPSPTTGYAALQNAGFSTEGTKRDGPAFICRINARPSVAEDPCNVTPPASAYWSYWHADAGQSSWSYSPLGAMSYRPKPGSVDAWVFGATDIGGTTGGPGFSPAQVRAANAQPPIPPAPAPAPEPTVAPPVGESSVPAASGTVPPAAGAPVPPAASTRAASSAPGSTPGPVAPSSTESAPPATDAASSTPPTSASPSGSGDATPGPAPSGSDRRVIDVQPLSADARTDGGGSVVPAVMGVALVAALGGAGGFVAWRRRQQAE